MQHYLKVCEIEFIKNFHLFFILKKYNDKLDSANQHYMEVRAPLMKYSVDYPIKLTAGFHFCKVLSPARAMEYIYVDSVKPIIN